MSGHYNKSITLQMSLSGELACLSLGQACLLPPEALAGCPQCPPPVAVATWPLCLTTVADTAHCQMHTTVWTDRQLPRASLRGSGGAAPGVKLGSGGSPLSRRWRTQGQAHRSLLWIGCVYSGHAPTLWGTGPHGPGQHLLLVRNACFRDTPRCRGTRPPQPRRVLAQRTN